MQVPHPIARSGTLLNPFCGTGAGGVLEMVCTFTYAGVCTAYWHLFCPIVILPAAGRPPGGRHAQIVALRIEPPGQGDCTDH